VTDQPITASSATATAQCTRGLAIRLRICRRVKAWSGRKHICSMAARAPTSFITAWRTEGTGGVVVGATGSAGSRGVTKSMGCGSMAGSAVSGTMTSTVGAGAGRLSAYLFSRRLGR
jgi:hypothetical protein